MDYTKEFEEYLDKLSIEKESFGDFFSFYNNQFSEYGNEVYEDIRSRLTHLKYFLENSWWNNRFHFLFRDFNKYSQIIDLGFSVPYLPLRLHKEGVLNNVPKLLYVDGNDTSKKLAKIILTKLGISADFVVGDLQDMSTWENIQNCILPSQKVFVSFETIEHLDQPEKFWNNLKTFSGSDMILSLPIGPKIPSHATSFENANEVKRYLEPYLAIREEKVFSGKEHDSAYEIYTCLAIIK